MLPKQNNRQITNGTNTTKTINIYQQVSACRMLRMGVRPLVNFLSACNRFFALYVGKSVNAHTMLARAHFIYVCPNYSMLIYQSKCARSYCTQSVI